MGIGRDPALKRAVFFDRDGVLNEAIVRSGKPHPPSSIADLRIDASAAHMLARLRSLGFGVFVVTNQPDVARGATSREAVEAINERLLASLPIDGIYVCYHDTADRCACRKPKPGMLFAAAREHGIDLTESYLVGDRWADIAAGKDARCKTIWIERGYEEPEPQGADARVSTLSSACTWILDDCARTEHA